MLVDDLLKDVRCARVIPDGIRVNHSYRSLGADSQAVGFGAEYLTYWFKLELFEPIFQVAPGNQAIVTLAALVFPLIAAEKNVPFDVVGDTELVGLFFSS